MSNWRDELSDDMKGNEALANFEDIPALAQGFIDAKSYQGASIKIPGEDAGDDARKEFTDKMLEKVPTLMYKPNFDDAEQSKDFYRSMGMPDGAEKYEMPEIKVPDDVELKSEKLEAFRGIAHKHGLTAKQFKGVMADVIAGDITAAQEGNEVTAANMTAIKEKFGAAFSDNMGKIDVLLSKTGAPKELIEATKKGMVNVETVNWLYQMGKQMGGEGFDFKDNKDDLQEGRITMTPDEAQVAINEINANRDHAYWKGTGDDKKRATDRMVQLMKFAHPNAATEMPRA